MNKHFIESQEDNKRYLKDVQENKYTPEWNIEDKSGLENIKKSNRTIEENILQNEDRIEKLNIPKIKPRGKLFSRMNEAEDTVTELKDKVGVSTKWTKKIKLVKKYIIGAYRKSRTTPVLSITGRNDGGKPSNLA